MTTATPHRNTIYYRRDQARTAAARAQHALAPRCYTAADAGAVVRAATQAERDSWVTVTYCGGTVAAVGVEAE